MLQKNNLLIELGMEEIPALCMEALGERLLDSFKDVLKQYAWPYETMDVFAAPRQLALSAMAIAGDHALEPVTYRGPRLTAAYRDGELTEAAIKWMSNLNITAAECHILSHKKGEFLAYTAPPQQMSLKDLVAHWLLTLPSQLSIERSMRWEMQSIGFIRPLRWLIVLWGSKVLPCTFFGVRSDRYSRGHRLQGYPLIALAEADHYLAQLENVGSIIPEYAKRKALIWRLAERVATAQGYRLHPDERLLAEITGLVSYPTALLGSFDINFLSIPEPVLVTTMKQDQRYFPVYDEAGNLKPHFVVIVDGAFKASEEVVRGHERVLSARFADAQFFWRQDLAVQLIDRLPLLSQIQVHPQLGSLREKTDRLVELTAYLARAWNADVSLAKRAALLAKTDLSSELVGEFPTLQGILGGCYAATANEPELVCTAIAQQYHPKSAKDDVPRGLISIILGLADRLEHLAGFFSIGYTPTGEKDPFGLRRAGLGIVRLLIENKRSVDMYKLIGRAVSLFCDVKERPDLIERIYTFICVRLCHWYQEQGISTVYLAAIDYHLRSRAFIEYHQILDKLTKAEPLELKALSSLHLRLCRLLEHVGWNAEEGEKERFSEDQLALLKASREKALYARAHCTEVYVLDCMARSEFWWNMDSWKLLMSIAGELEPFFTEVRVQVEHPNLKLARIGLLQYVHRVFLYFADFSKLGRLFEASNEKL